jgi:2-iminobutanoate/2-iminopropanoate deaminase
VKYQIVHSPLLPDATPFSQAVSVEVQRTTWLSGQLPSDTSGDAANQAEQVLDNVKVLLESAGLSMENLAKITCYLVSLENQPAVEAAFTRHIFRLPPAWTVLQVAGLPGGAAVAMDCVAVS